MSNPRRNNPDLKEILEYEGIWINLTLPLLLSLYNKFKASSSFTGHQHSISIKSSKILEILIGARLT